MNRWQLIPVVAGVVCCFSFGLAAGIGLAIVKPAKVRQWARALGRPDYNQEWYYKQTVHFHRGIDACAPDGSVLFIGDSFIQGMCVTEAAPSAINYGIGGDTTEGILARLPLYKSLSRARAVVFAAGDNDLRRGSDESAVVANYQAILSRIPENVAIFFCSLTPCSKSAESSGFNQKIIRLNREANELCAARANCHFIDLNTGFADEEGYLQARFDDGDGVHLNGAGYRICIEKLHESIVKLAPLATAKGDAVGIPER